MIETKYEAVEYFTFLHKICSRNGCDECESKSCGVLFMGNYAYSVNADILGKIKVSDNLPINDPIFWSYGRCGEIDRLSRDKFLLNARGYVEKNPDMETMFGENFADHLNRFLNRVSINDFYIRKQDLISYIEGEDFSEAKQNKMKVTIESCLDGIHLHAEPIKWTKAMNMSFDFVSPYFAYPGTYQKIKIDNAVNCTINLLSFYEAITNGFQEYEILRIKYGRSGPVVIEGRSRNKDEIFFAISQIP